MDGSNSFSLSRISVDDFAQHKWIHCPVYEGAFFRSTSDNGLIAVLDLKGAYIIEVKNPLFNNKKVNAVVENWAAWPELNQMGVRNDRPEITFKSTLALPKEGAESRLYKNLLLHY